MASLLPLLNWWLSAEQQQVVHAAAVGRDGAGVLLVGPNHSGKSTAALACLTAGFEFAGDDHVLLGMKTQLSAHCLYSSAKLKPSQVQTFPDLSAALSNVANLDSEKALPFLDPQYRKQITTHLS
ncbi:MAG: serine kinase, partial [Chloroflexi bacterium]|nr:serine kinase [Chloroflexota bacterium]